MKSIAGKFTGLAAALGFALMTGSASATPISIGQWYTFGFSGSGGDPLISGSGGFTLGDRSIAIGDPAWTFDCPTDHCKIVVTDGFLAVDRFEIFDLGLSLGLTSAPSGDATHSCGTDELGCLADPQMSHRIFIVGTGSHEITGTHVSGIPGAGFLLVTVPEPGSLLLIGAGLLMLVGMRRRA
jgi:hypothetical protein